jgi:hypothetical protein
LDDIEARQWPGLSGASSSTVTPDVFEQNWRNGITELWSQVKTIESRGDSATTEHDIENGL